MNVWTPTRPTPAWHHTPAHHPLAKLWRDILQNGTGAATYGPGAFAATQVAPADPDAVLWPQMSAQPLGAAAQAELERRAREPHVTAPALAGLLRDGAARMARPTRVEQIADLIGQHRADFFYDGTRVGCTCGWWVELPRKQDVEVQHSRHLAELVVALDRVPGTGNLTAMRAERTRYEQSIHELNACLRQSQDDADGRSDVASVWRTRYLTARDELAEANATADRLAARVLELEADAQTCGRQRATATDEHDTLRTAARVCLEDEVTVMRPTVARDLWDALHG